ncbi:MAG TPA: hypothetical protein VMH22_07335 [bacterium]|nr:hypothetical protein [bacterium]
MRRIVLVIGLVVVVAIAGFFLLRPKGGAAQTQNTAALADSSQFGGSAGATHKAGGSTTSKAGKVAGTLKASTLADRKAKAQQIRDAERARKKEMKRQARQKTQMLARARGRHGGATRAGAAMYVLKAIVALGNDNYALVDSRKVQVGDVVLGRKIVQISPDRIVIEAFGKQSTVRVGESLVPASYVPTSGK